MGNKMARAALVAGLALVAAAAVVSAGRVQVTPPGFYELEKAKLVYPSCNLAGDNAYRVLTGEANTSPSLFIHKTADKDVPKFAWTDPGKTLCNGADRIIYLSMGIAPKDKFQYSHHAVLQTFGGGKYAMLYQSYSEGAHKDDQGKSYTMAEWIEASKPHIEGKADPNNIGNLPPILKSLPCDCADMAGWLQALLDSDTASVIKAGYNRLFTPQNDKVGVKAGLTTFWGAVWQEKDFFHLYKFMEGVPSKTLKTSAFLETAVAHGVAHRVKTPAALLGLKQARKQHVQRMRKAKIVAHL